MLKIKDFRPEDAGQYQCIAKNVHGEAHQHIFVELACKCEVLNFVSGYMKLLLFSSANIPATIGEQDYCERSRLAIGLPRRW